MSEMVDAAQTAAAETRAELAVPRDRRYVPGKDWRAQVPKVAAIIVWIIAVLSIATSLIPPIRRRDDIIRDVTEVIGLSRRTILRLVVTGEFPRPRRIRGKRVLFDAAEVKAWFDRQPRGGVPQGSEDERGGLD